MPDVLKAIENAKNRGWYNIDSFDVTNYENLNKLDEGDINWIIPKALIATSSPAIHNAEGLPPSFYMPFFRENNVTGIVRLNEKLYDDMDFEQHGVRIYPMEFDNGSNPSYV